MNYTKGEWKVKQVDGELGIMYYVDIPDCPIKIEATEANAHLIAAAPDMYEALKDADKLIKIARQYFPKSIHNTDKFQLENTCATISKAINKAEGK